LLFRIIAITISIRLLLALTNRNIRETFALTMDQDTETTGKPLSTFKENTRGSLKSTS